MYYTQPRSGGGSNKIEVFINLERDYFRTRLTHTLEVAQVRRTIARALGASEDLLEVICLAHDRGHSPFDHAGEYSLKRMMQDSGDFIDNKQLLRIVTELEQRYPEFPGLNLNWETREGIVKHESEYYLTDAREFNPELHSNRRHKSAMWPMSWQIRPMTWMAVCSRG